MNKLPGIIKGIIQSEGLMLVDLEVEGQNMSALLTESPFSASWIKEENSVSIIFKETEVSLLKDFSGKISLRNQMLCQVVCVKKGEIIGCVKLKFKNFEITSAITSRAIDNLDIREGDTVTAVIKANEVSIMKL